MLALVFGISVILYIFDVPIIPSSTLMTPTVSIPTPVLTTPPLIPTIQALSPTNTAAKSATATVDYMPEGRSESITVSLQLNNRIITELHSTHSMNMGKSRMYQQAFEAEIQPLVVGKDINSLNLSRVAGASLTTDAFMQAIATIRSQI